MQVYFCPWFSHAGGPIDKQAADHNNMNLLACSDAILHHQAGWNIGSDNGLCPYGTKPLPEPITLAMS